MGGFPLFPEQASTFAPQVDLLYFVLIAISLVFAGVLPFVILYLIVRYHRSQKVDRSNPVNSNLTLELAWTAIPLLLVLFVFFWGAYLYVEMRRAPADALEVYVIGKQWMWHAQHPNGKRENNELHVPVGRPVKLIMTSQDVIHSFYIPAFRVKQDVLPGRYTTMWFEPTKEGEYHLFCAEYCGTEHSVMGGRVVALSLSDYQRWLTTPGEVILPDGSPGTPVDGGAANAPANIDPMAFAGGQLFTSLGCVGCHRMDGTGQGPSLQGIFGEQQAIEGGESVVVDENYIRNSILNPQAQIVAGYPPIMPSYEGQLSDDQLNQLVAYVKSLTDGATEGGDGATGGEGEQPTAAPTGEAGGAEPTAAPTGQAGGQGSGQGDSVSTTFDAALATRGETLFSQLGCIGCHRNDGNGVGPSLQGIYNQQETLADGSEVVADEAYIRESIVNSTAKVVEGYQPVMPSYGGQVNDDDLDALVEYVKSLGE